MKYKIIYHMGEELTLKTKVDSGSLNLENHSIAISGKENLNIPFSEINKIEMFRLHGLGRMLKLNFNERTLFLSVIRFNLFGYFVMINFFKTGQLLEVIKAVINNKK